MEVTEPAVFMPLYYCRFSTVTTGINKLGTRRRYTKKI
jgi:hypothetical protein